MATSTSPDFPLPELYLTEHATARVSRRVDGTGYVHNVVAFDKGRGHGSEVMRRIVADADTHGVLLGLHARTELYGWYRRFGFEYAVDPRPGFVPLPYLERRPQGFTWTRVLGGS